MVAQGAAAALRTRPLPQPTASSLVVEIFLFLFSCLLCGEEDGVDSLGGCGHMRGMYILRHNEAVWIILRWLLRGRLGASVLMHDCWPQT